MADFWQIHQPDKVSEQIAEYLEMTAPRTRGRRRPPNRSDQDRSTRPLLDNRDLSLEEGNDFA